MKIIAEISVGELVDKVTILEIKRERIASSEALANVKREYELLFSKLEPLLKSSAELVRLKEELKDVNSQLWEIEDAIRDKESKREFDEDFISLARSVYFRNDQRCAVKRKINDLLGSEIIEEKSYSKY